MILLEKLVKIDRIQPSGILVPMNWYGHPNILIASSIKTLDQNGKCNRYYVLQILNILLRRPPTMLEEF